MGWLADSVPSNGSSGNNSVILLVAFLGFLGVTVAPIALALINRGGKSKEVAPEVAVPRPEYDGLLEQLTRLDDENDRLARENTRLVAELRDETMARMRAELEVAELRRRPARRKAAEK